MQSLLIAACYQVCVCALEALQQTQLEKGNKLQIASYCEVLIKLWKFKSFPLKAKYFWSH